MENILTSEIKKDNSSTSTASFKINDDVVYNLHGRCKITSILTMTVDGKAALFYKLEPHRLGPVAKNQTKKQSSILLPIENAESRGLRKVCSPQEAEQSLEVLAKRTEYFDYDTLFYKIQSTLEKSLHEEGIQGAAKVLVYLSIRKHKESSHSQDLTRMYEHLYKAYTREVAEVLTRTVQSVEESVNKVLNLRAKQES